VGTNQAIHVIRWKRGKVVGNSAGIMRKIGKASAIAWE